MSVSQCIAYIKYASVETKRTGYTIHLATGEVSIEVAWPPSGSDLAVESVCRLSQRQVGVVQKVVV